MRMQIHSKKPLLDEWKRKSGALYFLTIRNRELYGQSVMSFQKDVMAVDKALCAARELFTRGGALRICDEGVSGTAV